MKDFSFETIKDFDKHINLSIPNYDLLINHIISISHYFIKEDSLIYDFGCSTGKLIKNLKNLFPDKGLFYGIDKEDNLIKDIDYLIKADLKDFSINEHSLGFLIFTLQFLPIKLRIDLLKRIYDNLEDKGALIIAEKTYLQSGFLNDIFTFSYYDFKLQNFTEEEVLSKQVNLRSLMTPLTEAENIKLFKDAGFRNIETIWQSLQFKAWILTK